MTDKMQRPETSSDKTGRTTHASGDADDDGTTPLPAIISIQPTPVQFHGRQDEGYFGVKATESQTSASTSSVYASPAQSVASSSSTSLKLRDAIFDVSRRLSIQVDAANRASAHAYPTSATAGHTTGTTIITAAPRDASGPQFPNQAYSALHQQTYPPPHIPPPLRTKSLFPSRPLTFSSAAAALYQHGSKTADSSPAPTPGLFNPAAPESETDTPSSEGYYPSPYLHWSHRQAPKETHVADVDVDPISGRKIINEYEIIDELGRGTHGKVKLGRNLKTGEYVAIKIVERYSKRRRLGRLGNAEDKVKREVAILKKARHPNIVALLEVIDDPARKKVYIVLERVDLGEIAWRLPGSREISMVECRRYDRESMGNFDDDAAAEEDQAMLDLARVRREKDAQERHKHLRRTRTPGAAGLDVWSIEFGGDTDEEESDLDKASRISTGASELSLVDPSAHGPLARVPTRSGTPSSSLAAGRESPDATTPIAEEHFRPHATTDTYDHDPLEGTMYGSYEDHDHVARRKMSHASHNTDTRDFGGAGLGRNLSHGNLMERARELLDADVHPDLMYVPCMTVQAARIAFRDTLLGLQYLHYQGIIHRDIKPPNLLQTRDRRIKISDFGVSYLGRPIADDQAENLSESDAQDFDEAKELAKTVGTAAFYAPELCYTEALHDTPPVGKAIDVWALGITLFCMLFGRVPFVDMEYVVMRRIADEDIYVPHKRLRPVDPRPKSRPSSHGRHLPHAATGTRSVSDLEYEELQDTLLDLLHRLLIKDPRKRITLEEVRHHPWVVADIADKRSWLDETDPSRQSQGKKIEISNEELHDAVVPIQLIDRIRSGIKKAVGSLGLGRSSSQRKRAPSIQSSTPSGGSSGTSLNLDARRRSLRGDESILSALKASREGDHPLSQSVTASPEIPGHEGFGAMTTSLATPRPEVESPVRPGLPDRAASMMSTSTSVRTVRATDPGMGAVHESAQISPLLSPTTLADTSGGNKVAGLLSGAGRLLRGVRDRSTTGNVDRERSRSRASSITSDAHGEASLAISNASAAGHMDPPQALKETPPTSAPPSSYTSQQSSARHSMANSPAPDQHHFGHLHPHSIDERLSHQSSSSSLLSVAQGSSADFAPSVESGSRGINIAAGHESTAEDFHRADDALIRRRIAEDLSRPTSSAAPRGRGEMQECPPSPDDETYAQRNTTGRTTKSNSSVAPSLETSPASPNSSLLPLITPSASEDRFALNAVASSLAAASSPTASSESSQQIYASDYSESQKGESLSQDEAAELGPQQRMAEEDDLGYHPDRAIDSGSDSEEFEDSSDDDGGLQMMRRKSTTTRAHRQSVTTANANAQLARYREKRDQKTSRSGSNNTMRKVRSRGESEPEEGRRGRHSKSGRAS